MTGVRRLVAPLVALVLSIAWAGPARADVVAGQTSSGTAVLYPGCSEHPVSYQVEAAAGVDWTLVITVLAPDGTNFDQEYVTSYSDPPQGSFDVQLCDSLDMPGRYTVTGAGTWGTVDDPWTLTPSTFVVRRAMTRTTLKAAPLGGGRYRLTVVVRDERPKGYYPTGGASGVIEELKGGRWVHVRGATYLVDQHGRASGVERVVSGPRVKVRALTRPDFGYSGSTSRPVTLRR